LIYDERLEACDATNVAACAGKALPNDEGNHDPTILIPTKNDPSKATLRFLFNVDVHMQISVNPTTMSRS